MEEMSVKTFGKNVLRTIHFSGVRMLNKECAKSPKYLVEDHPSGINLNTCIYCILIDYRDFEKHFLASYIMCKFF